VRQVIDIEEKTKVILGDVVTIHVEGSVLDGARVDNDTLRAVGRMAGASYVDTRRRFEVNRPA
jgi:flavin reductase (DIM6/NTAB) family NADH-FMN oxidoreductase RutF